MKTLKKYSEVIFIGILFLYGCAALFQADTITGMQQPGEFLTPQRYVLIVGSLFVVLCAANMILGVFLTRKKELETEKNDCSEQKREWLSRFFRTAVMMSLGFVFVIGMKVTGFYISAFVVVVIAYLTIEGTTKKDILTAIVFALGMCALFYVVFKQFHIYLPKYLLEGWLDSLSA